MSINIIKKYSFIQYKRIIKTNKLLFGHIIVFIPGLGLIIYYLKDDLLTYSETWFSVVLYYIFLFQSLLIVSKRLKNEHFFSSKCYRIFPQNNRNIYLYTLIFGIIDYNVILMLLVSIGMILIVTNMNLLLIAGFLFLFILCEITYLIYMMILIEIMTEKYGNSKNLFIVTFLLFMLLQQFSTLSEKYYLFDYFPISGWIGSTIYAALKGDNLQVLFYFSVTILSAIIGLALLKNISYPRKNNVF